MEMDAAQLERYEKLVTTVILYLNIVYCILYSFFNFKEALPLAFMLFNFCDQV